MLLTDALGDYLRQPVRSPRRTSAIQQLCAERLRALGVAADTEIKVPGAYRAHAWDVYGPRLGARPPIAISVRTLATSQAKNLPNRLDDMLAEATNLHRAEPRAVLGFLGLLLDGETHSARVFARLEDGISKRSGRVSPSAPAELFEHGTAILISADRQVGPGAEIQLDRFLKELTHTLLIRAASNSAAAL